MAAYLFSIIWPVALHMILSDFSVIILTAATGQTPDSALCTTLTAILVIPPVLWMYRGDGKPAANRLKSVAEQDTKKKLDDKENGGPTLTWRIFMGIACFVSGGILDRVWSQVLLWLRVQDYFSNQTQEQLLASQLAVQIIGLGILVPVAEELIFRGLLYARLRRMLPVWASVLTASVIFALYHGNMIQILFAFPMAIILTLLYEKGKWISYPILFHMGVNLTTVVLGALAR
ncbi:MAG: CPBP family intramembrane glutamic endopeptidase [Lachnospiraceae bacterium]